MRTKERFYTGSIKDTEISTGTENMERNERKKKERKKKEKR